VETADAHFLGYRTTDFTGKLSFQLLAGEERILYVIPRQGSFAIARLTASKGTDAPLRIIVPNPRAALQITTQTRSGAPAANIWFLVRYNSQVIPLEVF